MLKTRQITASTTPTVVASATVARNSTAALSLLGASLYDVVPVLICSTVAQAIYLGGSSMTTASTNLGIPFVGSASGAYFTFNLLASDPLFAMTTDATVTFTAQAGRQD